MSVVLMKCGHSTHAVTSSGEPVCVICVGMTPDARIPATESESKALTDGRMMRCSYQRGRDGKPCAARTTPVPSNPRAAFFASKPSQEFDEFYCGCWGWD
jgi:hypothetical protein